MNKPKRPRVTRDILEALTQAYGRMEADDLTDLPDDEAKRFEKAGEWLTAMWQFFPQKAQ